MRKKDSNLSNHKEVQFQQQPYSADILASGQLWRAFWKAPVGIQ